jgi:putative transposase
VVKAVIKGGLSRHKAAAILALASVQRSTGYGASVRPAASSRTRSAAIGQRRLRGRTVIGCCNGAKKADFTVRGLVAELAERGLKVDYRTVWEFVHAEKLSYKKDADCHRTGPSRRCPSASTVGQVSGTDRSLPPGVHRRDQKPNGAAAGLGAAGASGSEPQCHTAAGRP